MSSPDDTIDPATFQSNLCEQLTPATVVVWWRGQAVASLERGDLTLCHLLGIAARNVEKILDVKPQDKKPAAGGEPRST